MATLQEALRTLDRLKHEQAVWFEVVEFLSKFVDSDMRAADAHIESPEAGQVPQQVIADTIKTINKEKINPLGEKIDTVSNINVDWTMENTNGDKNQSKTDNRKTTKSKVKVKIKAPEGLRSSAATTAGRDSETGESPQSGNNSSAKERRALS